MLQSYLTCEEIEKSIEQRFAFTDNQKMAKGIKS